MTDNNATNNATSAPESSTAEVAFGIQKIYLKDLSFETPNGLQVFGQSWKPTVQQDLNIQVNALPDNLFEVIMLITIEAAQDNKKVFIVEVKQAGLFTIAGIDGIQLSHAINTLCPQILFPYVRETIDNTLVRGGYPPMMLAPLNFDAIFAQAVHAAQQQEAAASAEQADAKINAPASETLN